MVSLEKKKDKKNSKTITQALLNELKGNLFEFLVAKQLAHSSKISKQFLDSLSSSFQSKILEYDQALRAHDKELYLKLGQFAKSCCEEICKHLKLDSLTCVELTGKEQRDDLYETDIFLKDSQGVEHFLSLKFTKSSAYINTKSAGISSFFSKYFSKFDESKMIQGEFNTFIDLAHSQMIRSLNEACGYEGDTLNKEFKDRYSLLPGELPNHLRELLALTYSNIKNELFKLMKDLNQKDPALFKTCLSSLLGKSREEIIGVYGLYKSKINDKYSDFYIKIDDERQLGDYFFDLDESETKSSFNLVFDDKVLQIRVKPMSSYVQKSFKINCSIKFSE